MYLSEAQVKLILPLNPDYKIWTKLFNEFLPKYNIASDIRVAMFISQCSHESSQFRVLKENLNYSRQGLLSVFGKYFNESNVDAYARNPEKIASRVYANRMKNLDEKSGDGWKFRGRGAIQTTGRASYEAVALHLNKSIDEVVLYLETKEGALVSACIFWIDTQLNSFADAKDIRGATKRINGGFHGLDARTSEYKRISAILSRTNML